MHSEPSKSSPTTSAANYRRARERRERWEPLWRECYAYALPQQDGISAQTTPGTSKTVNLFDGTAPDAVDQLAASLLGELTPPWGQWFALSAGSEASPQAAAQAQPALDQANAAIRGHFERSNFAIEMHQCFLDLVTVGTACLLFEEAPLDQPSAFKFTAVPLAQVAFEESADGRLDVTYRRTELSPEAFAKRFPHAAQQDTDKQDINTSTSGAANERRIAVIESVSPLTDGAGHTYNAILERDDATRGTAQDNDTPLAEGRFNVSPFINFRWLKAPGEIYGRSPVMKALPDIKTANKVVELILKNASIAVTGIWQADDDGVLNPAMVQLVPGTIIPKAVGSQGLTPLAAPGRFDVSELVLEDLRTRIRKALLADSLGQIDAPRMTATEVLERSSEMTRLLGATYGRLQSELLAPLMQRALDILSRRGTIPHIDVDGRAVSLQWRSPLARAYTRHEARDAMHWIEALSALGPQAQAEVDSAAMARWLAKAFDVPSELIRPPADAMAETIADEPVEEVLS